MIIQQTSFVATSIKRVTFFPRAVRGANIFQIRTMVPLNARGIWLMLKIWGVTGTFAAGQGLLFFTYNFGASEECSFAYLSSGPFTSTRDEYHYHGPPASLGDGLFSASGWKALYFPPGRSFQVTLQISGTLAAGEGFDCQVEGVWLF